MFLPLMVTSQGQMDGSNQRKVGNHVSLSILLFLFVIGILDYLIQ